MARMGFVTIIILFYIGIASVFAQVPVLRLTTRIVGQSYCKADVDLNRVDFVLRYRFENTGVGAVILNRRPTQNEQVIVLKNVNGTPGTVEVNSIYDFLTGSGSGKLTKSNFVVVRPGGSYEVTAPAFVLAAADGKSTLLGAIVDGDHFLSLTVSTWWGSDDDADRVRTLFKSDWPLWTRTLRSEPMAFSVRTPGKIPPCPTETK